MLLWNAIGIHPPVEQVGHLPCCISPLHCQPHTNTHTHILMQQTTPTDPKWDVSAEQQIVTKSTIYMNDTLKSTLYWESQRGLHSAPQHQGATILSHTSQVPQLASPHWNADAPQEIAVLWSFPHNDKGMGSAQGGVAISHTSPGGASHCRDWNLNLSGINLSPKQYHW